MRTFKPLGVAIAKLNGIVWMCGCLNCHGYNKAIMEKIRVLFETRTREYPKFINLSEIILFLSSVPG